MSRKVLLLEEDATYAAEIRQGLLRLGFDVTLIRDGKEGLARAVSERFDLILLSAELPAINGFRICNRVKKDPTVGDVPLFMMGTTAEELTSHGRLPTRADDYFTKPLVFDELAARIRLLGLGDGPTETTAISQARVDLAAVAELHQKIAEQEDVVATLHRDLAAARANATRAEAQAEETARLRAALEDARRVIGMRPGSPAASAETKRIQELRDEHARALTAAQRALDAEKSSADGLRVKLAAAEAQAAKLESQTRDAERARALVKQELAAAQADRDKAKKQALELTARATVARPDVERLREELAAAKSAAAGAQAAATRAFDAERDAWTKARSDLEQAVRDANVRGEALEEQLRQSRSRAETDLAEAVTRAERLEATAQENGAEVARLRTTLMTELTSHAATRERAEKLASELASARASVQGPRIARLEQELIEAYEKGVASEVKYREAAKALSEATRRTKALEEEQTRINERMANTEEARDRAVSELTTLRKDTAEKERSAREEADRKRQEEIAAVTARANGELRTTEQSLVALEQAAATVAAENALAELRSSAASQHRALEEARSDLERARASAARVDELELSLRHEVSVRQELEIRIAVLERELSEAGALRNEAEAAARDAAAKLADQLRASAKEVASLRAEQRKVLEGIEAERQEDSRATEELHLELSRIAGAREQRIVELEEYVEELYVEDAARGRLEHSLVETRARVEQLEQSSAELAQARADQARAHEAELQALRERLLASETANDARQAHFDAVVAREVAEVEASWQQRLAEALEQGQTSECSEHMAEMDRLCEQIVHVERERAGMQVSFDRALEGLERAMERTRADLEAEREAHAASRAADSRRMESLEALIASRDDAMNALEREADEARGEIPELEAEIVVLRSELFSVRRQLDAQLLSVRVAEAELERHRSLLERAEQLLGVDAGDKPG